MSANDWLFQGYSDKCEDTDALGRTSAEKGPSPDDVREVIRVGMQVYASCASSGECLSPDDVDVPIPIFHEFRSKSSACSTTSGGASSPDDIQPPLPAFLAPELPSRNTGCGGAAALPGKQQPASLLMFTRLGGEMASTPDGEPLPTGVNWPEVQLRTQLAWLAVGKSEEDPSPSSLLSEWMVRPPAPEEQPKPPDRPVPGPFPHLGTSPFAWGSSDSEGWAGPPSGAGVANHYAEGSAGELAALGQRPTQQVTSQLYKTRQCHFFMRGRCTRGAACCFVHAEDEKRSSPDLAKTKLCGRMRFGCNDPSCNFAHSYEELRSTSGIYKSELCQWWARGHCHIGASCRFAHGEQELAQGADDKIPG